MQCSAPVLSLHDELHSLCRRSIGEILKLLRKTAAKQRFLRYALQPVSAKIWQPRDAIMRCTAKGWHYCKRSIEFPLRIKHVWILTFMQCCLLCHLVINLMILAWLYTVFSQFKHLIFKLWVSFNPNFMRNSEFHNNKFVSAHRPTPLYTDHFSSFYLNRVFLKSFQLDPQVDLHELWSKHTLL